MRKTTLTRVAVSLLIAVVSVGGSKRTAVPERDASAAAAAASCQEPPPPRPHRHQPEGCVDPDAAPSR